MAGLSQPSHHLIVPALSMSPSLSPLSDYDYEKKATTFISSCFSDGPEKKKITHSSSLPAPEMLKKRKKADFEEEERKLMVEKKGRAERKKKKKVVKEIPTGYVHVRARRGEATDSHSLAERARREKISDRMKLLQSLVPGCDKIIGKTLVLDEIINYVKSLQNQVEFLVGKLSSISPLLIEHEASLDTNTLQSENLCRFAPPLPSLLEYNSSQLNFFTETSLTSSFPLQHDKFPDLVSQNDGMTLWNMNDPYGFSNIYSL